MDVLHRSKEQRYAFDKIYRFQTSEVVIISNKGCRFILRQLKS